MNRNEYTSWGFFCLVAVVAMLVASLCLTSVHRMRVVSDRETKRYMNELNNSIVNATNQKIESAINSLKCLAVTYHSEELENKIDMQSMQAKAELLGFMHVYIIDNLGNGVGSDGTSASFATNRDIMSAFPGKDVVTKAGKSHRLLDGSTNSDMMLAVPIYNRDGTVSHVMAACVADGWVSSMIGDSYYGGEIFYHLIRDDGSFLVESKEHYINEDGSQKIVMESGNIFDGIAKYGVFEGEAPTVVELKDATALNARKELHYSVNGVKRTCYILPLDMDDLNMFIVTVENVAGREFQQLHNTVMVSNIIIMVAFLGLTALLFFLYRKVYRLAYVDKITKGISNAMFVDMAKKTLKRAKPGQYMIISVNINQFKLINEMFGKDVGDDVLRAVYERLKKRLRNGSFMCRYAADTFDIFCLYDSRDYIRKILREFVKDVAETVKINEFRSAKKYKISFSAGAYRIMNPEESFVIIRDRAFMARKASKRDKETSLLSLGFYTDVERERLMVEKEIENNMENALEQHQFAVYLQPKVDLKDETVKGAEALVRWVDPEKGIISPAVFIPFFEKCGFIRKLDLYVFEQVCKYIRRWLDRGIEPVRVSVNLSRLVVDDRDFLKPYIEIQEHYGVPSKYIEFELTETMFNENPKVVIEAVDNIHKAGFYCSLDDFGSGYSSLNIIQDLYVDVLKLDKAFFRGTEDGGSSREKAVISSIVSMAKALGMQIVAEGVEYKAQADFLKSVGCDRVQGFLYSKPVELESFEKFAFDYEGY